MAWQRWRGRPNLRAAGAQTVGLVAHKSPQVLKIAFATV